MQAIAAGGIVKPIIPTPQCGIEVQVVFVCQPFHHSSPEMLNGSRGKALAGDRQGDTEHFGQPDDGPLVIEVAHPDHILAGQIPTA
jgi:hypothetical protein